MLAVAIIGRMPESTSDERVAAAITVCVPVVADGTIDPRWGRAGRIAVARVAGGTILDWHELEVRWDRGHDEGPEGAHHTRVARFLRDQGVDVVVAHHMGAGMSHMLERLGIRVHLGAGGPAREAVATAIADPPRG
jgi:predicted Fe-Mo cluster-binding NifX family protein